MTDPAGDLGRETTRRVAVADCLTLEAARLVGFPRVVFGRLVVEGAAGWRDATSRATPPEQTALLRRLEGHLMRATEGGRARLAAPAPAGEDEAPAIFGDPEAVSVVSAALDRLPPRVRRMATREVAFLATGFSTRAWFGPATFRRRDGSSFPYIVSLGPRVTPFTVLHEIAHGHLAGPPKPLAGGLLAAGGDEAHAALLRAVGRDPDAEHRRDECLADSLASCWTAARPRAAGRASAPPALEAPRHVRGHAAALDRGDGC